MKSPLLSIGEPYPTEYQFGRAYIRHSNLQSVEAKKRQPRICPHKAVDFRPRIVGISSALHYLQGFRRGTGIAVTKDNEKSFTSVCEFTVMRPTPGDDRIVWGSSE